MKIFWLIMITQLLISCTSSKKRKPANIFIEDDRIALDRTDVPGVGSIHKEKSFETIMGTGFLIDSCYLVTNYHLVRPTDEQMTKEDFIYFLDRDGSFIKATAVAFGKPVGVSLEVRAAEDWVILELEECLSFAGYSMRALEPAQSLFKKQKVQITNYSFPFDRSPEIITQDPLCFAYPGSERVLRHDCAVKVGSSGSPLLQIDEHGKPYVIGIQSEEKTVHGVFNEYNDFWANIACPIAPVIEAFKNLKSSHQREEVDPESRIFAL